MKRFLSETQKNYEKENIVDSWCNSNNNNKKNKEKIVKIIQRYRLPCEYIHTLRVKMILQQTKKETKKKEKKKEETDEM